MEVRLKNNIPILNAAILKGMSESLLKGGQVFEAAIVQKINSNIPPPLKEETVKWKSAHPGHGGSLALVATTQMISQVTSELRDGGKSVVVGVIGERAQIAAIHEFGAPLAGVPERSFIRSVLNDKANRDEVNTEVITVLREAIKGAAIK